MIFSPFPYVTLKLSGRDCVCSAIGIVGLVAFAPRPPGRIRRFLVLPVVLFLCLPLRLVSLALLLFLVAHPLEPFPALSPLVLFWNSAGEALSPQLLGWA